MNQGSTLDIKATPADFTVGDFSDPQVPRGPWCAWHGYYGDCPECAGREERWTFTVVQADAHALVVDETWSGSGPAQTGEQFPRRGEAIRQQRDSVDVPAALDHVPVRVNPGLLARIRLLLDDRPAD